MRKGWRLAAIALTLMAVAALTVACDQDDSGASQENGTPANGAQVTNEIVVNLTAGVDDTHRATLALLFAESAIKTDHDVVLFLNVDGVELGVSDLPETVQFGQFPPIRELMAGLIDQGTVVLACPVCLNEAGITADQLMEGISLATPNDLFPYFDRGAAVISY